MAKKTQKPAGPDLSHIHEKLRHLAVPIGDLVFDPANARKHGEKNLAAIRGSLKQYGQRKPIIVQTEGMIVRAGNGTLEAATQLGWTHIAALPCDDDNVAAIGFAIADNRTAELAEWDTDVLGQLMREVEVGVEELQEMFSEMATDLDIVLVDPDDAGDGSETPGDVPDRFDVIVKCKNEQAQAELLERLTTDGFECRALNS